MESDEELSESELKKKAYLIGLRLKNSGLDAETIYARLEKEGIPETLAKQVVQDVLIERRKDIAKEAEPLYNIALVRIALGVIVALVYYLIFPNDVKVPVGLIIGGLVAAYYTKRWL